MSKKPNINLPVFPADQLFLERPRLHGLLAKALDSNVLLVAAGEGYGKTYAVSSFLRQRPGITAWLRHSEQDNQPWHFWENYANAVDCCKSKAGIELREIGFPETAQQFSRWLEMDWGKWGGANRFVIVGDDFHRIKSPVMLNFIERRLNYIIPNYTLILICRGEPPVNLLPSLSKGRLTRIDAEDLLFTEEEIADYFRLRNIDLGPREIAAIHRDSEGWPLALELLATEMRKNRGIYTRYVFEKGVFRTLEDDLFASVPGALRAYLVKLSLFEQWPLELLKKTAPLLPEQYRPIPALLAELEKLNALVRYDYYLRGFHIHPVFLDYLREKQKDITQDEIKEISAVAAAWFLENNLKMDAAIYFGRARNYAAIAGIVDTFPRIVPRSAAEPLLDIIERLEWCGDRDEGDEHFIYLCRVIRGQLLICLSRLDEAVKFFRKTIKHFEALPPSPIASRILGESWEYMAFIIFLKRHLDSSEDYCSCLENSARYFRTRSWPLPKSMTFFCVNSYVAQIGHPVAAGEYEQRIKAFAENLRKAGYSLNGYLSGLDDLTYTEFAYFQGDLHTTERCARRAIIKAREKNQYEIENRALFFLMRLCVHRGGAEELLEIWKQKDALLGRADYNNRDAVNDIIDGWMYIHLGEPDKAPSWLRGEFDENEQYSVFHNYEPMVKAKYLFAEKKYLQTVAFINSKENQNGLGSFLLGMLEMNCLEAAARFRLGETAAALALLEKTYEAAIRSSLIMPFIELGNDMRGLAAIALDSRSSIPRPWLEDIRRRASAYGKSLYAITEQIRNRKAPGAAVYLTRLERAVLQDLSRGQTREAIAAAAGQPLSAVKSVISRVYKKLGAVNRADAVRIASILGILE